MNSWTSPVDIRPDHLAIVQEILRVHLPAGFQVWVFGSRANWTTKDSSDLDLAVAGAAKLDHKAMVGLEVAFEESDLPYTVDVVDLKAVSSNFKQIVEDQRVLLTAAGSGANVHGEWREGTLGGVIEFKRGYDLPQRDRIPGSVPLVSSSGVTDFHAEAKVKGPGVVTGRYGTLGEVFFIQEDFWPLNTALYVRDFKGNDPRFISYFLRSLDFSAYSDKAAVPGLNRNHLHEATVRYPTDIAQQRAIAHVLGTLDDKIELNRRMNRTLEKIARAIFQNWFVDFGPTRAKMEGLDPYLPPELWDLFPEQIVDSELGEIPDGWENGALSDSVEILSGGTPRTSVSEYWGGNVLWYTPKDAPDLSDIFVLTTERSITMAGVTNSSTQVLPAGTTVISARGTVGRLACLGLPMAMNQTCYGIRGASGYPDYFTYWNVRNTVQDLQARTHGTVFDTITRDTFKIAKSVLVPTEVAEAFETIVYPLMGRILGNLFESLRLTGLRDTLLPPLISGKLLTQIQKTE